MSATLDEQERSRPTRPDQPIALPQFRCRSCGYGACCKDAPERCPMCGGSAWQRVRPDRPPDVRRP